MQGFGNTRWAILFMANAMRRYDYMGYYIQTPFYLD